MKTIYICFFGLIALNYCQAFRDQSYLDKPYVDRLAKPAFDWERYAQVEAKEADKQNGHQQDNHNQENQDQEQEPHMWQNRCGGGMYTCERAAGFCISPTKLCDRVPDCPYGEDEDPVRCGSSLPAGNSAGSKSNYQLTNSNRFRGQGFMFHIKQIKVANSHVKLFNQDSDRIQQK